MSQASERLLLIDDSYHSAKVASMIADHLLESDRQPYIFSINHYAGPPRNAACPLVYDWSYKRSVGITRAHKPGARTWIVAALMRGYTVQRCDKDHRPDGPSGNIERARWSAQNYQSYIKGKSDDDDIPF